MDFCVIVGGTAFASDDQALISDFKEKMKDVFDVRFYGKWNSFIRWVTTSTS